MEVVNVSEALLQKQKKVAAPKKVDPDVDAMVTFPAKHQHKKKTKRVREKCSAAQTNSFFFTLSP